jgi:hypothetical protein
MRRAIPRHRRDVDALLEGVATQDLASLRDLLGTVSRALEGSA